ncbi:MAG: hypothetical protein JNM14_01615 [Ferruginibacter sp.]|nr:hypothetical protein [Ferruginibacter sp.]
MNRNLLLLLMALCSFTYTQAQKNKNQPNKAAAASASEDKGWKPTKGDTRNPFDTTKTKQAKADGLSAGDDPFGKTGGKSKKKPVKKNGYANQEISYVKPSGSSSQSQSQTTPKPVKGKKQLKTRSN